MTAYQLELDFAPVKEMTPARGAIITRAKAKTLGLPRFFDGLPCKRGHISERWTANHLCIECRTEHRLANPERYRAYSTEWHAKAKAEDPIGFAERRRRASAKWYKRNAEKAREYVRQKRKENPEREKASWAGYRAKHKERLRQRDRDTWKNNKQRRERKQRADKLRRAANPEEVREYSRKRYAKNPARIRGRNKKRARLLAQSTPAWADLDAIAKIYLAKVRLEKLVGCKLVVDHIMPLTNPNICGLHVAWNLRIITAKANTHKGNRLPWQE